MPALPLSLIGALLLALLCPTVAIAGPRVSRGACCQPDGTCRILLRTRCVTQNGWYRGRASTCTPSACDRTGACCMPMHVCVIRTVAACQREGGTHQGIRSTCRPQSPCFNPSPRVVQLPRGTGGSDQPGACCMPASSTCEILDARSCLANGGSYFGNGSACTAQLCVPAEIACCFGDDLCAVIPQSRCETLRGLPSSDGTACTPATCPAGLGACCMPDDSCRVALADACQAMGGEFGGSDSACAALTCDISSTAACCLGDMSCRMLSEVGCRGVRGVHKPVGMTCDGGACAVNPSDPWPINPWPR